MNRKHVCLLLVACAVLAYLLLLQPLAIWPFNIDDMYVPLRYAKHWVAGQGLLWNVNEVPVEGYSNFSFLVLAALALRLGADPVLWFKLAGLIGLFATTWGLYCLTRLWASARLALIPSIWLLFYKGQMYWSLSGLETTVYQALLCFALYSLLRASGYQAHPAQRCQSVSPSYYWLLSGVLFVCAALTRPEAPFLLLVFAVIAWLDQPGTPRAKRGLFVMLLVFALLYVPYFFWRWHYFGRLFPNPVYCKGLSGDHLFQQDKQYLRLAWPFLLLALTAVWRAPQWRYAYFLLPSLLYLILLTAAHPVSAFDNRLFLSCFALLLPLSLSGLQQLIALATDAPGEARPLYVLTAALLLMLAFIPGASLQHYRQFSQMPVAGENLRQRVRIWLDEHSKPGDAVVLADSGLIPYYSPLDYIDSYCLNNRKMTEHPDTSMYTRFCSTILAERPAVFVLTSASSYGVVEYTPADACLKIALQQDCNYQLRGTWQSGDNRRMYRYEIYHLSSPENTGSCEARRKKEH